MQKTWKHCNSLGSLKTSRQELDLYCETCGELICLHCTISKHCRSEHKYDLVGDTSDKNKAEITASLEPIENQLSVVSSVIEQLDLDSQLQELSNQQMANEADIEKQIQQLHEVLDIRKTELINQVDQQIQIKKKDLAAQKDTVETVQTHAVVKLSVFCEGEPKDRKSG